MDLLNFLGVKGTQYLELIWYKYIYYMWLDQGAAEMLMLIWVCDGLVYQKILVNFSNSQRSKTYTQ